MSSRARLSIAALAGVVTIAGCGTHDTPASPPSAGGADVERVSTPRALERLLGDVDRSVTPPQPTASLTDTRFDLRGADVGHPVLHQGRLFFFFCDALTTLPTPPDPLRPLNVDVVAYTDDWAASQTPSTTPLVLQTYLAPDGKFLPLLVDGQPLLGDDGPTAGFSDGQSLFAFFNVGASAPPKHTFLAISPDDGRTFHQIATLPAAMVFISTVVVDASTIPALPFALAPTDPVLLVYGRDSGGPLLAAAPLATAGDLTTWRYDLGPGDAGALAQWSDDATLARPLFTLAKGDSCAGNFSVDFVPGLGRWLLPMRCFTPLGLSFFSAPTPFGPWSTRQTLLDPVADGAMCTFMHKACDPTVTDPSAATFCCDHVDDGLWGADDTWGPAHGSFAYGPQLVPGFSSFDDDAGVATVDFLVSTGNPYTAYRARTSMKLSAGD